MVMEKLGSEVAKEIDWSAPRLICIAGDFTRYDEHAVKQIARNIELIRYRRFDGNLLLLELVRAPKQTKTAITSAIQEEESSESASDGSETYLSQQISYRISQSDQPLRDLLDAVRQFLIALGDDVQMKELKYYIAFKRIKNFACVEVYPQAKVVTVHLKVDPQSVDLEEGFSRDVTNIGHFPTRASAARMLALADHEISRFPSNERAHMPVSKTTPGRLGARVIAPKYSDGGNLYLIVSPTGSRKWVLRFTWRGKAKEMGLGSATTVDLADARERAAAARRKVAKGINPIEDRKRDNGIPTFGEMADAVRETLSAGFRNEKHKAQWKMTLETYAAPLRPKPVDTIATDDVLAVLKPIWTEKAETASRLRGRIEKVLDAAKAKGFRDGENPARWRGHLDHLLPKPPKLARGHHAAMPYEDVAAFVGKLRGREATPKVTRDFLRPL